MPDSRHSPSLSPRRSRVSVITAVLVAALVIGMLLLAIYVALQRRGRSTVGGTSAELTSGALNQRTPNNPESFGSDREASGFYRAVVG